MSKEFHAGPEDVPVNDAVDINVEVEEDSEAPVTHLDPRHLGHGVHARGGSPATGMHVEDAALPSANHTGAGLGGMQIGDSRF